MVVTAWPNFNLYRMAVNNWKRTGIFEFNMSTIYDSNHKYLQVLPAASSPNISILISLFPNILESNLPILEMMAQNKRNVQMETEGMASASPKCSRSFPWKSYYFNFQIIILI